MSTDRVADDEILYRGVRYLNGEYTFESDGVKISSRAFFDIARQISVNRAHLHAGDPSRTQVTPADGSPSTDGVVWFTAGEVRAIDNIKVHRQPVLEFEVLVAADPLPNNPAHAIVYLDKDHEKAFQRLRHELATIATRNGWAIKPPDVTD